MPSPQIQFRAIPPLDTRLTERAGASAPTPAEVARRDLTRYYAFLADALTRVSLTEHEALLLCDALNDTWIGESADLGMLVAHLHHEIADTDEDGLPGKWGVDLTALVAKVASWTRLERLAVIDAVERWWMLPDRNDRLHHDTLTEAGLLADRDRGRPALDRGPTASSDTDERQG